MGLFGKKETRAMVGDEENMDLVLRNALKGGTQNITREQAKEIPSVSGSLGVLTNIVSSLPIKLYELKDGKKIEIKDDPRLYILNDDTKDTLTSVQFWRSVLEDYFLGKGAYAYIRRKFNEVTGLFYVEDKHISINRNTDPIFKDYDILVNGSKYFPFQFLKFLRNTKNGSEGVSVIDESSLVLAVAYNSLKFENANVLMGGNKRGYLQADKKLTRDAIDALKDGWKALFGKNENNMLILNDGVKFQETSSTCVELQLKENKEANSVEISMLFGVPSAILKGTATEEDFKRLIKIGVTPILNDFECSLDRDLLLEDEKGHKFFAFDTRELTRGSIKERYEAYKTAVEAHFMQIDEIREAEDLEPLGISSIILGLDNVLLDSKRKTIYTPNTNKTQVLSGNEGGENV